mgnify:CR=1 FL=1
MENTEKKIKILIKPQCEPEIRNRFITNSERNVSLFLKKMKPGTPLQQQRL